MFEEMRRIWVKVGHRPSKDEWNSENPKISYNAYRQRFRGWENACLRFIKHQMRGLAGSGSTEQIVGDAKLRGMVQPGSAQRIARTRQSESANRRDPSQALINKVWKRDNFRCRRCGRSPAIHFGVVLEVDHIIPWVKGGKTTFENLQTLCSNCNRSKKDDM
jgi:ribosomal protein L37E